MWSSSYRKFPQKVSLAALEMGTLKVNTYKSSTPKIYSRHLNLDSHFQKPKEEE